jgi:hypothetical protein
MHILPGCSEPAHIVGVAQSQSLPAHNRRLGIVDEHNGQAKTKTAFFAPIFWIVENK